MRFVSRYKVRSGGLDFNATPMIDIIFTLSIFYMLISTVSAREMVPMELPSPVASEARTSKKPDRVILNCRYEPGTPTGTASYSLGANPPAALEAISQQLGHMKQTLPEFGVVIRADRRLPYKDVRAAMSIVAAHAVEILNVAALTSEAG